MVSGEKEVSPQQARPRSLRGALRNTRARLAKKENRRFVATLAIGAVALLIAVLATPIVAQLPALSAPESGENGNGHGDDFEDLEDAIEDLFEAVEELRELVVDEIDSLRDQLDELESNVLDEIGSLSDEHMDLLEAIEDLELLLLVLQGETLAAIEILELQLAALGTDILDSLADLGADILLAIESLESRLVSLEATLNDVETRLGNVEDTLADVVDALGVLGSQLATIQTTLNGIVTALGSIEEGLTAIQLTLNGIEASFAGIEARLDETLVIRHITNYGAAIEGLKPFSIVVSCTENYLVKGLYADVSTTGGSTINLVYNQVRAKGDFTDTGIIFWRMGSTSFDPAIGAESVLPYQLLSQMNVNHPVGIPAGGLFIIDGAVQSVGDGSLSIGAVVLTSGTSVCSTVVSI